ncbi:hypothetical protein CHH69_08890 [Terribacillus saccharophilus]|uniref:hypothetical protein n=1 Tax=Terribacillus saccharophilus TaxID=361277 RepID=UPI000BA60012|nr:hypothetical protein [Terribacillus saccharophilus]PAF17694.1 hypothetical protein CHH51_11585 [Terribacillus saccharophilus]PAF21458.1 hypothetical protein CHH49_11200 [Terribacillus saccharophilus]PAF38105.1 hypothetical protein CHH69_08890 [Terribacillus saccharophilus]
MHFLVSQCYSWEGYHLVQALLEDGHEVSGLHGQSLSDRETHLSMYIGRHAMFREGVQDTDYKAHVSFFGTEERSAESRHHVDISYAADNTPELEKQILLPILYGEWMPRDEEAVQWHGKRILFDDEHFLRNALPIKPVMQTISKLLSGDGSMNNYRFYTKEVCPEQGDRAAIALTRNIRDDLSGLHKHYAQFRFFYE